MTARLSSINKAVTKGPPATAGGSDLTKRINYSVMTKHITRAPAAALLLFLILPMARAQAPRQLDAAETLAALRRLAVAGSVLYVAAHPDDEKTSLLSYLARGRGARTAYLSLTRGDGGQNILGSEKGVLLGVVRTQELLAARRIDGA